ncbi:MAG: class I SAM-dependent methyltransferase [Paracoccaceae bacterium]|nr:class I SAM-dependent methyltransferase [Paracoccaceae bacterium]
MPDRETLEVYARRAEDYARIFESSRPDRHLTDFMKALPESAVVLDLGCGTGQSSAHMQTAGFRVEAWDASPEMAAVAKERFGLEVTIAAFDAVDARASYDGVFANFSLLHARKSEMPGHLTRISTALRPNGVFHIGLKTGAGEARDDLGRFYAFYEDAEITGLLEDAGFQVIERSFGMDKGLAGNLDPWIILLARKTDD